MADGGFYVTLPSNSSSNVYPNNRSSDYRTKLTRTLDLRGDWEVALVEIQYPRTWWSFSEEDAMFIVTDTATGSFKNVKMTVGQYPSIAKLVVELNSVLASEKTIIHYDVVKNRIYMKSTEHGTAFTFRGGLAGMLGMRSGKAWGLPHRTTPRQTPYVNPRYYAPHPADCYAGFYTIYVYTDIVEYQSVGDSYVPLLRCVHIKGGINDMVTIAYDKGHYIPVTKTSVADIAIELKTDQNQNIPFSFGKVLCKLHFRPIKQQFRG